MPYHHLIMAIPWQLRIVIIMNRQAGLNLLVQAATEAIQQWARDVKQMRMGILIVIHTFGADMKWHPHIHLIVTGGGLRLDGRHWIKTDPNPMEYWNIGTLEYWERIKIFNHIIPLLQHSNPFLSLFLIGGNKGISAKLVLH